MSHTWIVARNEDVIAHEWHKEYSLVETKVLGALACKVTSKAKGVGCAEQHWEAQRGTRRARRGDLDQILRRSFLPYLLQIVMKSLQSDEPQPKGPVSYGRMMTSKITVISVQKPLQKHQSDKNF